MAQIYFQTDAAKKLRDGIAQNVCLFRIPQGIDQHSTKKHQHHITTAAYRIVNYHQSKDGKKKELMVLLRDFLQSFFIKENHSAGHEEHCAVYDIRSARRKADST